MITIINLNFFDKKVIEDIENDYATVRINPGQIKIILSICKELEPYIKIPRLALRCIIYYTLKEWQLKNKRSIFDIASFSLDKRVFIAKELFEMGKNKLKKILLKPTLENELLLDTLFESAFKKYIQNPRKILV
ncbi:MAG: hypothetical protein ACTSUX_10780 [Promethearchaeota archaeon]